MKVIQLYEKYMVSENLQKHMLKVAALAEILLNNWSGININKNAIIRASIFHDIAKPINFDLKKQAQFGMSPKDIKKLKELQIHIKTKYGNDEHRATVRICQDFGLNVISIKLIDNLEWKYIPRLIKEKDIESLIPIYCDMRIGPKGILTLDERLKELKNRTGIEEYKENSKNGKAVEQIIRKNVSIDIDAVTEDQLNQNLGNFLNLEI